MKIEQAFDYLNNANREIKTLRARVYAYEEETKQIEEVRSRLSKTEQRMLQAFQAFQNGTVQATHRAVRRYKADSTINTVLHAMQELNDWTHYKELVKCLNTDGKRTSTGRKFSNHIVAQVLSTLKKEGQVHNDGHGRWRYGKGPRLLDQVARG